EAGESAGLLMQNGKEIASITASKLRVPFAVKNGTPTGEEDGLFYPSKGGSLTVANDDAMTYPVSWKLWIDDRLAAEGNDTLQPSSSNHLQIKPDNDFYTWPSSGMLQDDLAKARLSLRFAPPGVLQDTTLPIKDIGYKIRLRYFSKGYQQIWNLVWVFLFLTAGAAISIAANVGIPNQTQRNAVHKQLRELGDRINALGPAADSSAVTFLRVERSRLEKRLHDTNFFSPNLAADLPQIRQGIDLLNSRVQVISEIRDLQEALHQTPSVSPSIMDSGLRTCRKNLKTAVQPDLSAQDISNVRASNAAVQQQLDSLGQDDPVLSAAILARETALKNRLPQAGQQDPAWQVFSPELQGILQSVMNAPAGISPDEYYNRDMATQIAMACADYVAYRKLLSDPEVIARVESEAANAKGMQEQTYPALLRGRSILVCIRQNAPASRVLEALQSTPPKAEIQVTPSTPSTYDLVSLQVRFLDPALNIDAVHQQFTCKWEVEHLPPKEGWSISHYFTKWSTKKRRANEEQQKTDQGPPQANQIVVKFFDNNQNPVIQKSGTAPVKLEKTVSVQQGAKPSRILIEVIRTGLVLLVALLGLVATAQDKIANLNIVQAMLAVLLLGITADTVKNLLAKSA
ncbi:MAG TPA: hypothetical protein VKL99_11580, partial [Candidatus Angelobacter sp.]|nr:hypothetical protein [Candidatus Angelobacter sp.]